MGVNCIDIEKLLERFIIDVWFDDNFEDNTIDIDLTQGDEFISLYSCSHNPSL
jgi:hypothetical protein